jgi:hypothetical protein
LTPVYDDLQECPTVHLFCLEDQGCVAHVMINESSSLTESYASEPKKAKGGFFHPDKL